MYKTVREPTGRYHFAESYLKKDEIKRVLDHYSDYIVSALYIFHDKDVKETDEQQGKRLQDLRELLEQTNREYNSIKTALDGMTKLYSERSFETNELREQFKRANISIPKARLTKLAKKRCNIQGDIAQIEADMQDVGNLKTPHWHILLKTYDDHTAKAVRKWFYRFRITENKEIDGVTQEVLVNTLNQLSDSPGASRDYLTHRNNPEKYQYEAKDVIPWGDGWSTFNHASRCNDDSLNIIDRIIAGESMRSLAREYGKDFIYHHKTWIAFANMVNYQETEAYDTVNYTDEVMQGSNQKLKDRIDWTKVSDNAYVVDQFQKFMKEVNPFYIEIFKHIENGVLK